MYVHVVRMSVRAALIGETLQSLLCYSFHKARVCYDGQRNDILWKPHAHIIRLFHCKFAFLSVTKVARRIVTAPPAAHAAVATHTIRDALVQRLCIVVTYVREASGMPRLRATFTRESMRTVRSFHINRTTFLSSSM